MSARHLFLVAALVGVTLIAAGLVLDEHHQGSGPSADDGTPDPVLGNVRWTAVASELGVSGAPDQIAAVGDDLFVVRIGGAVWGFDTTDGTMRWRRELRTGHVARTVGGGDLVPIVDATGGGVAVTAVDAETGLTRWVAELPEVDEVDDLGASEDAAAEATEPASGPRIVGTPGAVLARTPDGMLHGLDRTSGERRWSAEHPGVVTDADRELALVIEPPGGRGHDPLDRPPDDTGPGVLRAVEQSTGEVRWSVELPTGAADTGLMAVIVPEGDVVAADGDGAVRGLGRGSGETRWEQAAIRRGATLALDPDAGTVVTQDRSRMFIGLEAETGFVRWRHDWLVPGPAALLAGERRAVVLSADDQLAVIGLDHGTRLWEEQLSPDTTLTAGADVILIADRRGQLTGFDLVRGQVRWQIRLPLGGGVGLTTDDEGHLYWRSPVRGAVSSPDPRDGVTRWMTALAGASAGEPRIAGSRLVLHHATVPDDWQGQREAGTVVSSLDRDSGDTVWEAAIEPDAGSDDDAPSPVAIDEDRNRVVIAVGHRVRALTYEGGDERWEATVDVATAVGPVRVDTAAVVADRAGTLHAFAIGDGDPLWSAELDGRVQHLVDGGDRRLLATTDTGELTIVDVRDGRPLWTADLGIAVSHRPTVVGDVVIAPAGGDVLALDLADGTGRWRTSMSGPLAGAPTGSGSAVVTATTDGTLAAFDAAHGRLLEHHILRPIGAGPVLAGPMSYVVSVDGEIHALAPDDIADDWPLPPIHPRR